MPACLAKGAGIQHVRWRLIRCQFQHFPGAGKRVIHFAHLILDSGEVGPGAYIVGRRGQRLAQEDLGIAIMFDSSSDPGK